MAKDMPRAKTSSRVSGKSAPEHATMKPAPDSTQVAGGAKGHQRLTGHHGSVGKEMASKMPSDRVADSRVIPTD